LSGKEFIRSATALRIGLRSKEADCHFTLEAVG
jgi:hypothetical protein